MNVVSRILQRAVMFAISVGALWLIVTQVFVRIDERTPLFVAFLLTYAVSAYVILPQIIHLSVMVLRRGRIPHMTRAPDGLPADPVNIILTGTMDELVAAFAAAGWHKADELTLRTGWKMVRSFILNKPYPEAPFSSLYLFGREQDFGFQEAVGDSPRKRHHIRFWAANINPEAKMRDLSYWMKKRPVDHSNPANLAASHIWVGAGTQDLGLGLAALTYQISHRTDKRIDAERDYILGCLRQNGQICEERSIEAETLVAGKYISDGKIVCAKLVR
jgi:hypothetical protein